MNAYLITFMVFGLSLAALPLVLMTGRLTTGSDLYRRQAARRSKHPSAPRLTAADHRELSAAIVAARKLAMHAGETQSLQEKLAHAVVFPTGRLPAEVITMHSRAELLDLETGEQLNLVLVFPIDAKLAEGRVSVFHPLGRAMLGRGVGDRFDWNIPYGARRFEVRAVHFQPEAALAEAA